jgi:hypothetical protein
MLIEYCDLNLSIDRGKSNKVLMIPCPADDKILIAEKNPA